MIDSESEVHLLRVKGSMIESWAKKPHKLHEWIHRRSTIGPLHHGHVANQRKTALWITLFAAIRTFLWIVCMLIIVIHWVGVGGSFIHGFIDVSSTVLFVTFISFYCNASTDAANLTAGLAALFSADSHGSSETNRQLMIQDFSGVEADIARLAELQPGPDALDLATKIRARIAAASHISDADK
jgi:hypothetical protein